MTRSVHMGKANAYEKEMYTRVLLGNLNLERIIIKDPNMRIDGTIDHLARQFLWQIGEDYGHGTGIDTHIVGCKLILKRTWGWTLS